MLIGRTKSVCPVCLKVIQADKVTGEDGYVYMKKGCPEHGDFSSLLWEDSLAGYMRWSLDSRVNEPPVDGRPRDKGCPYDCGLCTDHLRKGCCMLLELTNRCNLRCPVCFAAAGEREPRDLSIGEIEKQYDFLMAHGGPFNIQLSGGEPTMRNDLPEIIRLGREKGFTFFQLNTNGIRLAEETGYAEKLKAAGLNTVFLQFDGLEDEVYIRLRGKALLDTKRKAIENCAAAGLGIVLVPVIAQDVNEGEAGKILQFALDNMPAVRGVHFQPVSYFGRCGLERPEKPITIPKMLRLIEEQTDGLMKCGDFGGGGAENPYCSFHASYMRRPDGSLKLLQKKTSSCCCCTTSDDSRTFVANQWDGEGERLVLPDGEMTETSALDEFLEQARRNTFAVSGMIFQDAYNLDLDRLRRCYICEVDSDFGMVPFCAYNLTDVNGRSLYRK